tara:strand:- start:24011 stop:25156 length:1146 start_codon:yes stop_codon:yes gene_type:complete
MLTNKIYQNYIKDILKTFFVILFGLSIIAWTARAVNFLDLIVESGYSFSTYFYYSFLVFFGIITKFVPLSFLIALMIFILKQTRENEFIILWTSGVKKLKIVNLFLIISLFIVFLNIALSTFITPFALNKSRLILNKEGYNSILPTIRIQQFSDSFEGFTFIVEKKIDNELKNVFIHDKSNVLKSLTSDTGESSSTTIVSKEGIVDRTRMVLFDGQILSAGKDNTKNNILKFQQLNIDLRDLQTGVIKTPKIQETKTIDLLKCWLIFENLKILNCKEEAKKEITSVLNRRIFLPLYLPVIALMCSLLLIKNNSRNNSKYNFLNQYSVFAASFLILLYAELILRFSGLYKLVSFLFIISPLILIPVIYIFLIFKFKKEFLKK